MQDELSAVTLKSNKNEGLVKKLKTSNELLESSLKFADTTLAKKIYQQDEKIEEVAKTNELVMTLAVNSKRL